METKKPSIAEGFTTTVLGALCTLIAAASIARMNVPKEMLSHNNLYTLCMVAAAVVGGIGGGAFGYGWFVWRRERDLLQYQKDKLERFFSVFPTTEELNSAIRRRLSDSAQEVNDLCNRNIALQRGGLGSILEAEILGKMSRSQIREDLADRIANLDAIIQGKKDAWYNMYDLARYASKYVYLNWHQNQEDRSFKAYVPKSAESLALPETIRHGGGPQDP